MISPAPQRPAPTAGESPGPKRPPRREIAPSPPAPHSAMNLYEITHTLHQLMAQGANDLTWSTRVNDSFEDMAVKLGIEKMKTTMLNV